MVLVDRFTHAQSDEAALALHLDVFNAWFGTTQAAIRPGDKFHRDQFYLLYRNPQAIGQIFSGRYDQPGFQWNLAGVVLEGF